MALGEWSERYGVVAGITARGRGVSLGLWSEENVRQVMSRWRALRAAFRPAFPAVVLSHQIHGTSVQWHHQGQEGWLSLDGVDGHATGTPGVLLTVTVADCVPIDLVVPKKRVVALLHAGWRGTAGGMLEHGVALLRREAFVTAQEIVMHCGVGICGACYEVGFEVLERLTPDRRTGVDRAEAGLGTPRQRPGARRAAGTPGHGALRGVRVRQAHRRGGTDWSVSPRAGARARDH